jgi:hypothetical protein
MRQTGSLGIGALSALAVLLAAGGALAVRPLPLQEKAARGTAPAPGAYRAAMHERIRALVRERMQAASEGERPEADDPIARRAVRDALDGERDPAVQLELLAAARAEAQRYGIGGATPVAAGLTTAAALQGSAWVSLGPDNAAFSNNGGLQLTKIDSGRARRILPHPTDPNIVYFAVSGGGVWKTFSATRTAAQGGPSWFPITDGIGSLSIGSVAMNPQAPDSLLLGLGDFHDVKSPGVLHSEDGGVTWSSPVALSGQYGGNATTYTATSVRDIQFDPKGTGTVLAATDVGVFRAGTFGQVAQSGWVLADVTATSGAPGHLNACWSLAWLGPQTWLATCQDLGATSIAGGFGAGKLYKSTDDGVTWSDYTGRLPADLTVPSQPGLVGLGRMTLAAAPAKTVASAASTRVYALAANNLYKAGGTQQQKDLFSSDDGGETWKSLGAYAGSGKQPVNPFTDANYGLQDDLDVVHAQADYNQALAVDPANPDHVFAGGNLAMLRSLDGGSTWAVMAYWLPDKAGNGLDPSVYVHADWHAMAISYAGGTPVFWAGTDGGLFRSGDVLSAAAGKATFDDSTNRGLVTHLAYSVASGGEQSSATCAAVPDLVFGGLQDNGTRLRSRGSPTPSTFNAVTGGDGFGVAMGCTAASGSMGSLLLGSYVAQILRSTDSGQSFGYSNCCNRTDGNCFIGGTLDSASGTCKLGGVACPTTGCIALDGYYNFIMFLASDRADGAGRTMLVPITDGTCAASGSTCTNASYHLGSLWYTSDGGATWSYTGKVQPVSGAPTDFLPAPAYEVSADGKNLGNWVATTHVPEVGDGPTGYSTVYVTSSSTPYWLETAPVPGGTAGTYLPVKSAALDWSDASGSSVWAASNETNLYCAATAANCATRNRKLSTVVPSTLGHVFHTKNGTAGAAVKWTAQGASGSGLPYQVPVNVIAVDPGDANIVYAGTEMGLYKGTYVPASDTTTWTRWGTNLPLVSVTALSFSADGSALRISTFGRGFLELNQKGASAEGGVLGNGDLDGNQQLDAFDLVAEAALLFSSPASSDYRGTGNLTGAVNLIDGSDVDALVARLGGRP